MRDMKFENYHAPTFMRHLFLVRYHNLTYLDLFSSGMEEARENTALPKIVLLVLTVFVGFSTLKDADLSFQFVFED